MSCSTSVIGLGFVGGAILKSFQLKNCKVVGYDKYKPEFNSTFKECVKSDIAFLCLPTVFDEQLNSYDKSCIHEVCGKLESDEYKGIVVIKSTVEPGTTMNLAQAYPNLKLVHNPEFLTAATAFDDFHNQEHIVLGKGPNVSDADIQIVCDFYNFHYPDAEISKCVSIDSESMKIFVNCFYSTKIQFFNELYAITDKMGGDYCTIRDLMLKNKWIHPMHTSVPGTDGLLSYGGGCFPKDTNALCQYMKKKESKCAVLEAVIEERNTLRND
jgi:nucleotide sugar dehydrogenase